MTTSRVRNAWQAPGTPCPVCRGRRLWRSVFGVWACGTCHPPAGGALVAEWWEPEETADAE